MANVVIVFWSRLGATERLALNAAVGAVQGRANIRLRWLREESCDASDPQWQEQRTRMEREYIGPRLIDLEWAEGLVLATPARVGADAAEWQAFFKLGSFEGKSVALLSQGEGDCLASFPSDAGWSVVAQGVVTEPMEAQSYGHRVAGG